MNVPVCDILCSRSAWLVCETLFALDFAVHTNLVAELNDISPSVAHRTLRNLTALEVLTCTANGQRTCYQPNSMHPAFPMLKAVFDSLRPFQQRIHASESPRRLDDVVQFNSEAAAVIDELRGVR